MLDKVILWIYESLGLNKWVDFESSESRWNLTAIFLAIALFFLALVPTTFVEGWRMAGIVSAIISIIIILVMVLFLVYFRRNSPKDKEVFSDIKKEMIGINQKLDTLINEMRQDGDERKQSDADKS